MSPQPSPDVANDMLAQCRDQLADLEAQARCYGAELGSVLFLDIFTYRIAVKTLEGME